MTDPVHTLTFSTAAEALAELRRRCLADRATTCEARWTDDRVAIRLKGYHHGGTPTLLCSDGVFRPEVIQTPEQREEWRRLRQLGRTPWERAKAQRTHCAPSGAAR